MNRAKQVAVYSFCALLAVFTSCGKTNIHEVVNRTKTIEIQTEVIVKKINGNDNYKIVRIGGCEYVVFSVVNYQTDGFGDGSVGGITHKGNCDNH